MSQSRPARATSLLSTFLVVLLMGSTSLVAAASQSVRPAPAPNFSNSLKGCPGVAAPGTSPSASPTGPDHEALVEPSSSAVHLPADEAPHNQPMEWWYFSGHLRGVDAAGHVHCYGFEYVTFQIVSLGVTAYVGNFAVTDLTRKVFRYSQQTSLVPVPVTKGSFSLRTGPWSMTGGDGHDVLNAATGDYRLDLHLATSEPAVLEDDQGREQLGPMGSSKYYSWTSLATTGTMVDHGTVVKLTGVSWMDHQWGPMNLQAGGGWDWFSVQLANNYQYMVCFVRNQTGAVVDSFGDRVSPNGTTQRLSRVSEVATGSWHSGATGTTYTSGWELKVPGGQFDIHPDLPDQELDLRASLQHNAYWEGDETVTGDLEGAKVWGVGYTEINPVTR